MASAHADRTDEGLAPEVERGRDVASQAPAGANPGRGPRRDVHPHEPLADPASSERTCASLAGEADSNAEVWVDPNVEMFLRISAQVFRRKHASPPADQGVNE